MIPLDDYSKGEKLSAAKLQQNVDATREVQRQRAATGTAPQNMPPFFLAKITQSTSVGDNQWKYSIQGVFKTTAGYGGWSEYGDVLTYAFNTIEDINSDAGTQGNGVDIADLSGLTLQPVPVDTPVWVTAVVSQDDSEIEYWFSYENGVTGDCA